MMTMRKMRTMMAVMVTLQGEPIHTDLVPLGVFDVSCVDKWFCPGGAGDNQARG